MTAASIGLHCIIGAGAAGIAAARALGEAGIPYEVLESADDVGGIWDSSRADAASSPSTHTISSKSVQAYPGFPMPDDYPDYPSQALVLRYLRSYAEKFEIRRHITFRAQVERVVPTATGRWRVALAGAEEREYEGVLLATGIHRVPSLPALPGAPGVEVLHSARYRGPEQILHRRVLVVGSRQSASDLLCECVPLAARTVHSARSGFYCIPKYVLGRPTDTLQRESPLFVRRLVLGAFFGMMRTMSKRQGLPVPAPDGFAIPIVGDMLAHHYTHGDIVSKGAIAAVDGDRVTFADGSEERVDIIFLATGFVTTYPFIDREHLAWAAGAAAPSLFLHVFPPRASGLYVIGMVRPFGPHWEVHEKQGRLVAAYIQARARGARAAERFDELRAQPPPDLQGALRFRDIAQEPLHVDKIEYVRQLRRHTRSLEKR